MVKLIFYKRIIIVRWADLSDFIFRSFSSENVYFCFTSNEIVTFLLKNGETPKRVVDFPTERDTFRNKIMENRREFCV